MDTNLILSIFTYSLLFSILFSFAVIIAYPLFKDYYDNAFEGIFPVYNLFKLCRIVGISEILGFLYLIPGLNVVMTIITGIKLMNVVDAYGFMKVGFVVLPILFIPLAAYIRPSEKVQETVAVTPEPEKFEVEPEEEDPQDNVDSIFKIQKKVVREDGENKPYKAKKVMVNEAFINSAPAEQEVIEKVEKDNQQ